MAHKKAAGTTKNGRDSNPKYLGIKITDGAFVNLGDIIVRQRGTKILAGQNVGLGRDHTLFALKSGIVRFSNKRKTHFDNTSVIKKIASVVV